MHEGMLTLAMLQTMYTHNLWDQPRALGSLASSIKVVAKILPGTGNRLPSFYSGNLKKTK